MNKNEHGFRVPTEVEDDDWIVVHPGAWTNPNPGSLVEVVINTTPICPNMSNKEFRKEVMQARDIGVDLINERIDAVKLWDQNEQARAETYFGRSDTEIRNILISGLPRLRRAMRQLVPEKIIRWDSRVSKQLSCSMRPITEYSQAAVCKPDSEKRVIAIHSRYCSLPFGELFHGCKIKTIIHECTHFTDTFDSLDRMYVDKESTARFYAENHSDEAIRNADSITNYIATFDGRNIR